MKKAKAIELLKLAVPIKALTQQEYSDFIEAINMGMDALKAQLSQEGATSDMISRQAAIDALDKRFDNIPMEQTAEILMLRKDLRELPTVQPEVIACGNGELVAKPEPQDIDAREAVYNLAEKIGIHQLFALTVELRGEPVQPEPHEGHWIGKYPTTHICSECGWLIHDSKVKVFAYCPNCGADMRGEKDG